MLSGAFSICLRNLPRFNVPDNNKIFWKFQCLIVIKVITICQIILNYAGNISKIYNRDSLWLCCEIIFYATSKYQIVRITWAIRLEKWETDNIKLQIDVYLIPGGGFPITRLKILIYLCFLCVHSTSCNKVYDFIRRSPLWFRHWRSKQSFLHFLSLLQFLLCEIEEEMTAYPIFALQTPSYYVDAFVLK